jgi:hypothetical protein
VAEVDDGQDRVGRSAGRLLALSIGGGAAITLLGAGAAHAQDATSTGNQATTDGTQALVVTPGSDPTIGTIHGGVANGGAAASNTGVNRIENTEADTTAAITPGSATSGGNRSTSRLDQGARSSATGGGLTLLDQGATIGNLGGAVADTGFNANGDGIASGDAVAWGNTSGSSGSQWLDVTGSSGALRLAGQHLSVSNGGLALAETGQNSGDAITTGRASGSGNESQSTTTQQGEVNSSSLAAATLEQRSRTRNRGLAVANTGANQTTGDGSDGQATVIQNGVITSQDPEP